MVNISNEVKFKIENVNDFINLLREKNIVLLGGYKEKTIRYDNENSGLENNGKYLRIRTGLKNTISIKEKIDEDDEKNTFLKRNDIEVEVSDIKKTQYILEQIGLKKTFIMEKYRLKWRYNENIELNLDELPFGVFLEIHGDESNTITVCNELGLNIKNAIKGTYWDIFEEFKIENNIDSKIRNIEFGEGYSYKIAR